METPWLIQRAKFNDSDREGIDGIIRLDYMGSAEFEFGAVPQSLKRIRTAIEQYVFFTWAHKFAPNKPVTVFCKKEDQNEVKDILIQLAKGELRLKEFCDLTDYVMPKSRASFPNSHLWWDIVNDFMFWKQNTEFETKFKEAIKHK